MLLIKWAAIRHDWHVASRTAKRHRETQKHYTRSTVFSKLKVAPEYKSHSVQRYVVKRKKTFVAFRNCLMWGILVHVDIMIWWHRFTYFSTNSRWWATLTWMSEMPALCRWTAQQSGSGGGFNFWSSNTKQACLQSHSYSPPWHLLRRGDVTAPFTVFPAVKRTKHSPQVEFVND